MASLSVFGQDDVLKTIISFLPLKSPLALLNRRTNGAARDVALQSRLVSSAGPLVREFSSRTCEWVPHAAARAAPRPTAARIPRASASAPSPTLDTDFTLDGFMSSCGREVLEAARRAGKDVEAPARADAAEGRVARPPAVHSQHFAQRREDRRRHGRRRDVVDPGRRPPELVDQGRDALRVHGLGRSEGQSHDLLGFLQQGPGAHREGAPEASGGVPAVLRRAATPQAAPRHHGAAAAGAHGRGRARRARQGGRHGRAPRRARRGRGSRRCPGSRGGLVSRGRSFRICRRRRTPAPHAVAPRRRGRRVLRGAARVLGPRRRRDRLQRADAGRRVAGPI